MTDTSPPSVGAPAASRAIALRALPTFALFNLPFLLAITSMGHLPPPLRTIVAGALLFFVPGLAWVDRRGLDGFVVVFRVVVYSLCAMLGCWLVALVAPGETNRLVVLGLLCLVTNVGLVRGRRRDFYESAQLKTPLFRGLTLCAALFCTQTYWGAAYFVPPLEDQDMEVQGTAYGLVHHFEPTMVTNRGKYHFFAHPLLLHFWIGWSALITDDLDALRYYHESAVAVQSLPSAHEVAPLDSTKSPFVAKVKQLFSVTPEFGEQLNARFNQDLAHFYKSPLLLATRIPNIFLTALTLFPLGFLVYRISGSRPAAIGSAVIYATLPEVYVRSSYGGYMAMTNFLTLSGAYFYLQSSRLLPQREDASSTDVGANRGATTAAYLGAWANQKWLMVAAAIGLHATIRVVADGKLSDVVARARKNAGFVSAVLVTLAFFAGWACYAVYGVSVAYRDFLADHLIEHVLKRFRLNDVNLATVEQGGWVYPSIVALWAEFCDHYNWLLAGVSVLAIGRALRKVREPEGLFVIWILIGALGFSLIDWRMTKHLSKILPPLVVLCGLLWASCQDKAKLALGAVMGSAVAWNVWTIANVMKDFEFIKAHPIW